ncbi:transglutaminase TgpA family protein [Actinopolymorpha alba]|uniref:transglutaminase TgpA family protein n=1 Tax=Actinopolymorpha alba TaxID=533267 RepID=UPI000369A446|nr:DUF3488 and transglutaminase-like domain-containing protein [Actinopolymorpha alba]
MSGALRRSIAGTVATLLACLALVPAYHGQRWLGTTAFVVLFVAAVGFGLRQLGTPRLLVPLGQLAALGWGFILVFARENLRFGVLPSAESVQSFVDRINEGLLIVVRYAAPVPYDANLVMVTALGVGIVAIAVDTLSATFRLAPWAGLPLLLLYSIPATTVSGGVSALAFVPAAIGYVLLLVTEGRERLSRWGRVIGIADEVAGPQDGVQTSLLGQTGRRVGAAVIGLSVVVPAAVPALPDGVFGQGEGSGFGSTGRTIEVDNPIVDLKRNLRRPQDLPVMSYVTDTTTPDYIKLVTLDVFDGQLWKPSQRNVRVIPGGGARDTRRLPEPPGLNPAVPRTPVRTTFQINNILQSRWLPTPYPSSVISVPGDWKYDPDTLDIVAGEGSETAGLAYQVTSLQLDLNPEALRAAGPAPSAIFSRYTQVPPDLPQQVIQLAKQHTAGARTNYDKAVALQRWFRTDFIYDLSTQQGHGGSAMLEFIADKRGYCEQFAATMAIMARTLGIPARVGIGYMPGTRQADNRWVVTAHDSHAWPELYFAGFGWVRFEPTPQAQTGSAPSWTVPDSGVTVTASPRATSSQEDPRQNRASASPAPVPGDNNPTGPTPDASGGMSINPMYVLAGVLVLLVLSLPMLTRLGIRRVRLSQRQPGRLVEGAWRELADVATDLGLSWDSSATPRSTGERLLTRLPQEAAPALRRLVESVQRSRYALDPGEVGAVGQAVETVSKALRAQASRRRRLLALLLPASLWRRVPALWQPLVGVLDFTDTLGGRLTRRARRRRTAASAR